MATLCRGEDLKFEQLSKEQPTGLMFITHFGNGDELDQELILKVLTQFGSVLSLTVLPGTNYAHAQMASADEAARVFQWVEEQSAEAKQTNVLQVDTRFLVFFHTEITRDKLKRHEIINFPDSVKAKSGAIPGLYIFEDFVTLEEEKEIIFGLDHGDQKW